MITVVWCRKTVAVRYRKITKSIYYKITVFSGPKITVVKCH